MTQWPDYTQLLSMAHSRQCFSPFAHGFIQNRNAIFCGLENAKRPPQQSLLHWQDAQMGKLTRFNHTGDAWRP
jgi:hypothetical protein